MTQEHETTLCWPRHNIFNVPVDALTVDQLHAWILRSVRRNERALVLNVNVHALNLAYEQGWFADYLNQAEIVFCDGAGVMLAARLLGFHIPERITYADWMWQFAAFAAEHQLSFYFLGGQPGVAAAAGDKLRARFPDLRIAGIQHGYFDKTPGSSENEAVVQEISRLQPNILLMGLGMPLQERWLQENWPRLNANIALTGGAVFDYLSGQLQRAPAWMTNNGLEWLGRLLIEPKRLWRRYVLGNPLFFWRVLQYKTRYQTAPPTSNKS
ncbi:MAG: WecB/TagA/CpsF family glycosyltransferase [Anaerolineales bacterium]|nr:WecB/TagA/CpsF family glycosyltransferase [Anaerolineales bacterium]MCB8954700.1 WecB/TagA/CpsF family glycosyltransferase [Ardenticatenales bacterium]